jgi:hypothetical protein
MIDELERIWKAVVLAYSRYLHLPGSSEENHENIRIAGVPVRIRTECLFCAAWKIEFFFCGFSRSLGKFRDGRLF